MPCNAITTCSGSPLESAVAGGRTYTSWISAAPAARSATTLRPAAYTLAPGAVISTRSPTSARPNRFMCVALYAPRTTNPKVFSYTCITAAVACHPEEERRGISWCACHPEEERRGISWCACHPEEERRGISWCACHSEEERRGISWCASGCQP